jgi:ADP-ribose pyrophosphatase YjhB (NUDIX family)
LENDKNNTLPDPKKGTAVGIVINRHTGQFHLVFNIAHKNPKAKIPGGRMKHRETAMTAFIREIWEELGLKLEPEDVMTLFSLLADNKKHYYHVFAALVDNFDGVHKEPVKDGKDLLENKLYNEITVAKAPLLLQHYVILKNIIRMIRKKEE